MGAAYDPFFYNEEAGAKGLPWTAPPIAAEPASEHVHTDRSPPSHHPESLVQNSLAQKKKQGDVHHKFYEQPCRLLCKNGMFVLLLGLAKLWTI